MIFITSLCDLIFIIVEPEGLEPSSKQGPEMSTTRLALIKLSGKGMVKGNLILPLSCVVIKSPDRNYPAICHN